MRYLQGQNREQLVIFPVTMESSIGAENEVRMIDMFVEGLDMGSLGFRQDHIENGRPAYHPKDLLKLYLYGSKMGVQINRKKQSNRPHPMQG